MALTINLQGRVALVTGVSSGIGAGIARVMAQSGADVIGCGTSHENAPNVQKFISEVTSAGSQALYVQANMEKPGDLAKLVSRGIEKFKRLDILVSNAGRNIFQNSAECDETLWQQNLDLNLASHWRIAKLCKPYLEAHGKGIVQIMTSNHAYATIPGCFPYNVVKTALTGLVRSLAIEWGSAIRVVGLAPGFIETPGNDTWFSSFPDPEAERQRTIKLHPAGHLGQCDDIGAWAAFLASDYANFATGTTYLIDGGRSALLQDA